MTRRRLEVAPPLRRVPARANVAEETNERGAYALTSYVRTSVDTRAAWNPACDQSWTMALHRVGPSFAACLRACVDTRYMFARALDLLVRMLAPRPPAVFCTDRQTGRQTDGQTDRETGGSGRMVETCPVRPLENARAQHLPFWRR
eukprot:5800879-Pyramimonas_sp.AAC.1